MINIERICLSATKKHTRREYLLKEYSLQRLVWWNVEAIHRKTFINVFKTQRDKTQSWKLLFDICNSFPLYPVAVLAALIMCEMKVHYEVNILIKGWIPVVNR